MSAVLTSYAVFCNGCMSRGKMFILSSGHNTRTVLGTVVAGRRGSCLVWTMMTSNWEANYLSDAVGPPLCGETCTGMEWRRTATRQPSKLPIISSSWPTVPGSSSPVGQNDPTRFKMVFIDQMGL